MSKRSFQTRSMRKKVPLPKVVVENITKARENRLNMGLCDKKWNKEPGWGHVLVERQRRGQNQGSSMKLVERQRSMKLKKKRNMEPVKGNKFVVLQFSELNQISKDVDIKIGHDKSDSISIINDMIVSENKRREQFVRDKP
jgi:hypothetical protein